MPLVTAVLGQHRRSDKNGLHAVWRQHMLLPSNCNPREREWAQACSLDQGAPSRIGAPVPSWAQSMLSH